MFNPFNKTKKEPKDLKEILDYLKTLDKDIKKLAQNLTPKISPNYSTS